MRTKDATPRTQEHREVCGERSLIYRTVSRLFKRCGSAASLTFSPYGGTMTVMENMLRLAARALGAFAGGCCLALVPSEPAAQSTKPAAVYYCPDRTPDLQISGRPAPGCIPLLDKTEDAAKMEKREAAKKKGREIPEPPSIKIENLEREISSFLSDYRKFLGCCINASSSLETVEELEDRAFAILKNVQEKGLANMQTNQRGITLSQLIPPVAQAKLDLGRLRRKLESLEQAKDKLGDLDYETAGRERKRIQQEEEALTRDFRPALPSESARTGIEIGDTTVPNKFGETFGDTTLKPATGTDIGTVVSPGSDQEGSLRPRMGLETQDSTLAPRHGPENQDTTLPYSFGFETEKHQNPSGSSTTPSRVGPNIGDSTLNQQR